MFLAMLIGFLLKLPNSAKLFASVPGFPELEIQLFGKPAEREESQGINFSK